MATPQLLTAKPAMLGSANCKRAKSTDCSMLFDSSQRSTSLLPMGKKPTMVSRAASIAPGEVIGKTPTPWGVSLRRRSIATEDKPKRRGVSGSNSFIRKRRSTLRATPQVEKKSLPKKTSSRKFKLKTTPFEMGNAPIFGIVLKSTKDDQEKKLDGKEEVMDLEFKGSSGKGDTKPKINPADQQEEAHTGPPFGVRLKPIRRGVLDGKINKGHTYQIDLKPPTSKGGSLASKYIPESKSFLEIRLKPVTAKQKSQRNLSRQESSRPEFVELQLRHVVAPVDGGPKRAVTQASFQIPVAALKHIDLNALRKERNLKSPSANKLAELLQIQIESLNHREDPLKFKGSGRQGPNLNTHSLRINLRHVDPNTGKTTWLPQSIQVELQDQEYETTQLNSASNKRSSMHVPPSMQVSLRPVIKTTSGNSSLNQGSNHGGYESSDLEEEGDPCEVAKKYGINRHNKIRLKSAVQVVHEEEEEVEEWDEEELSDDDYTDEELSEYDEQSINSEDKRKQRTTTSSKDGSESQPSYFQYEEIIEDTIVRTPGGVNLTPSTKRSSLPEMNLSRGRSSITNSIPREIVTEFELEEQELLDDDKKGDEYDEEEVPEEDEYDEHVLEDEYEEHEIKDNKSPPPKDEYEEHVLEDEYEEHEIVDKEKAPKKEETPAPSEQPQEEEYPTASGKSLHDESLDVTTDSESEEEGSQRSDRTPTPQQQQGGSSSLNGSSHEITAKVIFRSDTRPIDTTPPPKRRVPRRTRSRSLTEIDRVRQRQEKRREAYIKRKEQEAEEAAKRELSMDKRRDLLMWYNRMKCPNKNEMKRRVAKLPDDCDITPDDVELLPWLMKGRFLDLKVMNQFFMEDWQGKNEVKN